MQGLGNFKEKKLEAKKNVGSFGESYTIQELRRIQRHKRYLINEIRKRQAYFFCHMVSREKQHLVTPGMDEGK